MLGLLIAALLTVACFGQMDPGHHVVSNSANAACILKDTDCGIGSSIECWGDSQITDYVPAGNDFLSVAVGHQAACALRVTGSITCFGDERILPGIVEGVPTDTDFVQLGMFKGYNACALKASGEVKCWGQTRSYGIVRNQPSGVGYTAVTCGSNWCCAINAEKHLECWGRAVDFVKMKNFINRDQDDTHSFVGITIGHQDACALQENGKLMCWGLYGSTSMLGDYYWQPYDWKEHDDYQRVVMGHWVLCSIRGSSRTLYCFGLRNHYPLSRLPDEEINDVVAISGSQNHFCVVTADGNLRCWGLTGQAWKTGLVVENQPTDGGVTIPSDNFCVTQAITQCSASGATRASGKEQALADIPWMREQSVAESSGSIQSEELDAELKRDREMQLAEENNRLKKANEALLESLRELEA